VNKIGAATRRTIWGPMAQAFWDAMSRSELYCGIGFNEFRRFDGKIFAPRSASDVVDSELPAHYCQSIRMPPSTADTQPSARNVVYTVLENGLWFAGQPDDGGDGALELDHAIAVVFDTLAALRRNPGGLDGTGSVTQWSFSVEGAVEPIAAGPDSREFSYWTARYRVQMSVSRDSRI